MTEKYLGDSASIGNRDLETPGRCLICGRPLHTRSFHALQFASTHSLHCIEGSNGDVVINGVRRALV